jgi:SHS2 domain-containing protein
VTAPEEGWEYFEVAADVGVHAWGPDLATCLRQCGLGVFNLIVPLEAVRAEETREVSAQGDTPEALVVNWVNELLYLHDVEGFVVRDLAPPEVTGRRLHGTLRGEPVDPDRHPRGILVKAATFHGLVVEQHPGRVSVRLVLDI